MSKKLTLDQFIERSNKIHSFKYDYSISEYINNSIKLKIICPIHGIYEQSPNKHMSGQGCASCAITTRSKSKTIDSNTMVSRFISVHGDRYDYSNTIYKNARERVTIKCMKHGEFKQFAFEHLAGSNCKKCSAEKYTEGSFIASANLKHNNKYNYENCAFTLRKNNVFVTCPHHGVFEISAHSHLKGHGCYLCSEWTRVGWSRTKYVDFCKKNYDGFSYLYLIKMRNKDEVFFKIGISVGGVSHRYKFKKPCIIETIRQVRSTAIDVWNSEQEIIRRNSKNHYIPLIKFAGSSKECFSEIDIDKVNAIMDSIEL